MNAADTYIGSMILIVLGSVIVGWKLGFGSGFAEGIERGDDIWREALGLDEEDMIDMREGVLDAKEIE